MKEFWKQFLLRGLTAAAGGPVILGIVYWFLGYYQVTNSLSPHEVSLAIFTISFMAFVCGGITVIYQTERLSVAMAALIHGGVLYLTYLWVYLLNGWLLSQIFSILVFTGIFFAGYALVWLVIYFVSKKRVAQVNARRGTPPQTGHKSHRA